MNFEKLSVQDLRTILFLNDIRFTEQTDLIAEVTKCMSSPGYTPTYKFFALTITIPELQNLKIKAIDVLNGKYDNYMNFTGQDVETNRWILLDYLKFNNMLTEESDGEIILYEYDIKKSAMGLEDFFNKTEEKVAECCQSSIIYKEHADVIVNKALRENIITSYAYKIYQILQKTYDELEPTSKYFKEPIFRGYRVTENISFDKLNIGDTFIDKGFSSFSMNLGIAQEFLENTDETSDFENDILFKSRLPVGIKTITFNSKIQATYMYEEELILPANTVYKITDKMKVGVNELQTIVLDIVKSTKPSIENNIDSQIDLIFNKIVELLKRDTYILLEFFRFKFITETPDKKDTKIDKILNIPLRLYLRCITHRSLTKIILFNANIIPFYYFHTNDIEYTSKRVDVDLENFKRASEQHPHEPMCLIYTNETTFETITFEHFYRYFNIVIKDQIEIGMYTFQYKLLLKTSIFTIIFKLGNLADFLSFIQALEKRDQKTLHNLWNRPFAGTGKVFKIRRKDGYMDTFIPDVINFELLI